MTSNRSPTDAFSHLDPSIHDIATKDDDARYRHIYTDVFIEHVRARSVFRYLNFLFHMPRKVRMPGLVIAADSGMGKTHLLRQFQRKYADPNATGHKKRIPVAYCQVPPGPSLISLQQAVLHALGAPPVEMARQSARNGIITDLLREAETRMVMIDEAQHFLAVAPRERTHLYDWMKFLSTESRQPIVLAGVRGCEVPIKTEPQLSTRFRIQEITRWDVGPELAEFLHTFEKACPLRLPSNLASRSMMRAIQQESKGITDIMVHALTYAASIAIKEGRECITPDLLPLWKDPTFIPKLH
jgi:hypothetical protein